MPSRALSRAVRVRAVARRQSGPLCGEVLRRASRRPNRVGTYALAAPDECPRAPNRIAAKRTNRRVWQSAEPVTRCVTSRALANALARTSRNQYFHGLDCSGELENPRKSGSQARLRSTQLSPHQLPTTCTPPPPSGNESGASPTYVRPPSAVYRYRLERFRTTQLVTAYPIPAPQMTSERKCALP